MFNKPFIVFFLLVGAFSNSSAQSSSKSKTIVGAEVHEYYLYVKGVESRNDVLVVEKTVRAKSGVTFFLGNRYPVRYFLLKTNKPITSQDLEKWFINTKYKIAAFGEGEASQELALLAYLKNRKV